jgi:hypothetical protein
MARIVLLRCDRCRVQVEKDTGLWPDGWLVLGAYELCADCKREFESWLACGRPPAPPVRFGGEQ